MAAAIGTTWNTTKEASLKEISSREQSEHERKRKEKGEKKRKRYCKLLLYVL